MTTLFDEASSEDEGQLKVNTDYAERYNTWREKEEYQKLKDKYGESTTLQMMADDDDDGSSTSESEDEDGEWDLDVERQFFQTLASLKKKDPSIYNAEKKFFDKDAQPVLPKKTSKDKAFTLRDYERKIMLEKGGRISDDEETPVQTFAQEQEQLKNNFKAALQDSDSEEDILTIRPKTDAQKEKEEEEYKEWLKGRKEDIKSEDVKKQLEPLKEYWSDPKLDANEKFLKDFFLNKRYKCSEDKEYIPTYDEIVRESEDDLSEDEEILRKQMDFEHKYNFRFEEPDPEFIKRYPRTITNSLRKPDTSRKQKRDEIKERKRREKEEKKQEIKMLKKFKLKEIQEKLEQLKTITGNQSLPFQDNDIDGDFDPVSYDQKMGEIFNQEYYQVGDEEEKPEFPFDPEIDDEKNWDEYTGQDDDQEAYPSTSGGNYDDYDEDDGPHCEDPDFNMDCDYQDSKEAARKELIENTRRNRGRSRKSIFAQKVEAKKPIFDPQEYPNYEEYLEEYYKLDYEDIIGDQPVRYRYRTVLQNDFGLGTEEILLARDKELNQWCSVKKISQYRSEAEEKQDYYTFITKKRNFSLKKRVLPSIFSENPEKLMIEDQEKLRKKRRKNQGKDENPEPQTAQNHDGFQETEDDAILKKKKRKNKGKDQPLEQQPFTLENLTEPTEGVQQKESSQKRKKDHTSEDPSDQLIQDQPKSKKSKADKHSSSTDDVLDMKEELNQHIEKSDKKKKKIANPSNEPVINSGSPVKQLSSPNTSPNKKPKSDLNSLNGGQPQAGSSSTGAKKHKSKPTNSQKQPTSTLTEEQRRKKNRKKKNKKKKNKNSLTGTTTKPEPQQKRNNTPGKKNNKSKTIKVPGLDITDDRLMAYGIKNPKRFKNAMIFGKL